MQVIFAPAGVKGVMQLQVVSLNNEDVITEENLPSELILLNEEDVVDSSEMLGKYLSEALLDVLENSPEKFFVLVSDSGMRSITSFGKEVPIWMLTVHSLSSFSKGKGVDLRRCEYQLIVYNTPEDKIIFDIDVLVVQTLCQCPVMPVYGYCS